MKLGGARASFAITLAGSTVYVITDPGDVTLVYNSTTSLSFDSFLRDFLSEFSTTSSGIDKILQQRHTSGSETPARTEPSIAQIAHNLQVSQTQGNDLTILEQSISEFLQHNLLLENLGNGNTIQRCFLVTQAGSSYHVSLKRWIAEVFINAGQRAYFGENLSKLKPKLPQTLIEFDDLSWQVFYRYPKIFRRRLNALSKQILDSLGEYIQ